MLGVTKRDFTSGRCQAQIRFKPASSLFSFLTVLAILIFSVQDADARGLGAIRHLVELAARSGDEASKAAKLSPEAARFQSEVNQVRRIIEGRPDVDVIFQDADGDVRVLRQNADENEKLDLSDNGFADSRRDIFVTHAALESGAETVLIGLKQSGRNLYLPEGYSKAVELDVGIVNDRRKLVIVSSDHLTFSVEAWRMRGVLQSTHGALIDRSRIVVITDNATSKAIFKDVFGRQSVTVSTSNELERAIRRSKGHFVIVVGHVEDGNFVLRNGLNHRMSVPLDRVQGRILENGSSSLLLGCDVACTTPLTGATQPINMRRVPEQLVTSLRRHNEMSFLEELSTTLVPMHIETDFLGNLKTVQMRRPFVRSGTAALGVSAGSSYALFREERDRPASLLPALVIAGSPWLLLIIILYMGVGLWPLVIIFGGGPAVWNTAKLSYGKVRGTLDTEETRLQLFEIMLIALLALPLIMMRPAFVAVRSLFTRIVCFTFKPATAVIVATFHQEIRSLVETSHEFGSVTQIRRLLAFTLFSICIASYFFGRWLHRSTYFDGALPAETTISVMTGLALIVLFLSALSVSRGRFLFGIRRTVQFIDSVPDWPFYLIMTVQSVANIMRRAVWRPKLPH